MKYIPYVLLVLTSALLIGSWILGYQVFSGLHMSCHGVVSFNEDALSVAASQVLPDIAPRKK